MREQERNLNIIAHSSKTAYENTETGNRDRLYIPWREVPTAAARMKMGERVLTILPYNEDFQEYLELIQAILLDNQNLDIMYTPDNHYLMDTDIYNHKMGDLRQRVNAEKNEVIIFPYQATSEFDTWTQPLRQEFPGRVIIYADTGQEGDRHNWTDRGGHHPWISDQKLPKHIRPRDLVTEFGLSLPRGYIAQNKDEAKEARRLLDNGDVVLKSIASAGGDTIAICTTQSQIENYDWPINLKTGKMTPVAVQERLNIVMDDQGECVYSIHYDGSKIYGRITRQRMHGKSWVGNTIPAQVTPEFERACYEEAQNFLRVFKPRAKGGMDIAKVYGNRRPVLLDINARPTGAHDPKDFQHIYVPRSSHVIAEKVDITNSPYTAHEVWDILNSADLALDFDTQVGVMPQVWLKQTWAMLISSANEYDQAERQFHEARMKLGV